MFSTGLDMEAGPGVSGGAAPGVASVQDKGFVYQETDENIMSPDIPGIGELAEAGYLQHIKSVMLMLLMIILDPLQVRVRG